MPNPFFKKIQVSFWVIKAFLQKHGKIIGLGLIVGLLGFFLISRVIPYLPTPQKHVKIGMVGQYTLDKLPKKIQVQLSQGLVTVDSNCFISAGIAETWQVSPDNLVYTFKLRDDIFWQDGKKIKAGDINYSFKDVELKVIDDQTLEFKLNEPFSPFLSTLGNPVFKDKIIGTGPYKIEKIVNSNDFITSLTISGPEKKISYHFYPSVEAAKLGFKLGEIDIIDELFINPFVSEADWDRYIDIKTELRKDRYVALFFNNNDNLLGSKQLRQALAYAIENKPNDDSRAISPIRPDSWAFNPDIKRYDFDQNNAKSLLDKVKEDNNEQLSLNLVTSQAFLSLAEEIKNSWEKTLGLTVNIEVINFIPQDYQIFLGIQEVPIDPDQYLLWHSTRLENITNFKDVRTDKLLEDGRRIFNLEERKEKYFDFQKFLLEESPVAFLFYPQSLTISRKSLF